MDLEWDDVDLNRGLAELLDQFFWPGKRVRRRRGPTPDRPDRVQPTPDWMVTTGEVETRSKAVKAPISRWKLGRILRGETTVEGIETIKGIEAAFGIPAPVLLMSTAKSAGLIDKQSRLGQLVYALVDLIDAGIDPDFLLQVLQHLGPAHEAEGVVVHGATGDGEVVAIASKVRKVEAQAKEPPRASKPTRRLRPRRALDDESTVECRTAE